MKSVKDRFIAQGWNYIRVEDGNDLDEIAEALKKHKVKLKNQL